MRSGLCARLLLPMLLVASAARADRALVLELRGDRHERLRQQIEKALKAAHELEVVPDARIKSVARGHGLNDAQAMSPHGVAQLAPALQATIAVGGSVASTFYVRLFDPAGQELWSKELPVKKGLLSAENARKLAKAVSAAAGVVSARHPGGEEAADEPVALNPVPENPPPETPETAASSAPLQPPAATVPPREAPPPVASPPVEPEPVAEWLARPHWLTLRLSALVTFRSYCARPGVASCGEYDALDPANRPAGGSVQFDPKIPYGGADLAVELFPFATLDNAARGLGVLAGYHRGAVRTDVSLVEAGGSTPVHSAVSKDQDFLAELTFRTLFDRADHLVGWFGLSAGLEHRAFDVDNTVAAVLPGSHRTFASLGLDGRFPFHRRFALEASARILLHANPGTDEVVGFGQSGSGSGYQGELGVTGDVWGPVGYSLRGRYTHFADTFTGQGTQWPQGGIAAERYVSILAGATVSF